jgi:hypothetical protein
MGHGVRTLSREPSHALGLLALRVREGAALGSLESGPEAQGKRSDPREATRSSTDGRTLRSWEAG